MAVEFETLPKAFQVNRPANVLTILRSFFGVTRSTTPLAHGIPTMPFAESTAIQMTEVPKPLLGLVTVGQELRTIDGELAKGSEQSKRALASVDALQHWLNLNQERVAELVGISKSAIMYWKREGAAPRPASLRRLYKTYTLVRALKEASPEVPPLGTLESTRNSANQSACALLAAGHYDEAESLLRDVILKRSRQPLQRRLEVAVEDDERLFPSSSPLPLRQPRTVRKSRRLSGVDRSRK
ncbi:MAG: hypothetical protein ACYDAG_11770 [Chloroflexota bacterium]